MPPLILSRAPEAAECGVILLGCFGLWLYFPEKGLILDTAKNFSRTPLVTGGCVPSLLPLATNSQLRRVGLSTATPNVRGTMIFTTSLVVAVAVLRSKAVDARFLDENARHYSFFARTSSVPLAAALPEDTQIYKSWPEEKLRSHIPDFIPAVVVHNDDFNNTLMGPPIHVQTGDTLKVTLKNEVHYTGLSIHLHGFGYGGEFFYAGSVGVSQCPLAEGNAFTYEVVADETPGTYWYHTQSAHFGVDAYDAIRGPLIVHQKGSDHTELVNKLNGPPHEGYSPLAYDNERILFFQDGFLSSSKFRYAQQIGNLYGPVAKNEEGIVVSSLPWEFGTCNGKMRDVIHVAPNKRYKLRLINGGTHHALRISIDNFPLTVVAADSEPVEAFTVDEVVVHVGERFDVEIYVYDDLYEGESFWIRADTLEPQSQGYQNGIRAIMRVSTDQLIPLLVNDADVADPTQSIQTTRVNDAKTLNCHTEKPSGCVAITALSPLKGSNVVTETTTESKIHTVDTYFQPTPQYGHFVRVDGDYFKQNEFSPIAMLSRNNYRPNTTNFQDLHPHSVLMSLSRTSPNIIVWRTSLLMDHPMHLHGHKVEILDVAYPSLQRDCTLAYCTFSEAYAAKSKISALDKIPMNTVVKKDTFVIPAGGAVVTRIHASNRGLWYAGGQMDIHRDDGMSFVINVGDWRIPADDDWLLPIVPDFPSCNSSFVVSVQMNPSCECYVDENAPLRMKMVEKYYCSRSHLCRHSLSQASNLDSYNYEQGLTIQSDRQWRVSGTLLTAIFFIVVILNGLLVAFLPPISLVSTDEYSMKKGRISRAIRRLSSFGRDISSIQSAKGEAESKGGRPPRRNAIFMQSDIDVHITRCTRDFDEPMSDYYSDEDDDESSTDDDTPPDGQNMALPPPPPRRSHKSSHPSTELTTQSSRNMQQSLALERERDNFRHLSSLNPHSRNGRKRRRKSGPSTVSRRSSLSTTFERLFSERADDEEDEEDIDNHLKRAFEFALDGYNIQGKIDIVPINEEKAHSQSPMIIQLLYLLRVQLWTYLPCSVNLLRLVEVIGLALITGGVFESAGSDTGQTGVSQINKLMLVSTLIWTFPRMYATIPSHHDWYKSAKLILRYKRFSLSPLYTSRILAVTISECIWPTIYCFICFPMAGLVGNAKALCEISFLLATNNLSYISLGAVMGACTSSLPFGMIAATVISQGSILAAGVFTQLPPSLEWVRNFSPFFWTMQGLLKSVYRWTDTYDCAMSSSSDVGANQCFIEYDAMIEQYKRQGIHVATYNDASSENVTRESLVLVVLSVVIQLVLFVRCFFAYYKINWEEIIRE